MPQSSVPVEPNVLRWAIVRSGLPREDLSKQLPVDKWLAGDKNPTMKQLEKFANRTHIPLGYLFLSSPPEERLEIPDFRTVGDVQISRPSPDLIDTIHDMQRRQDWMREYLIDQGQLPLKFVGGAKKRGSAEFLARRIRKTLNLSLKWAKRFKTFEDALRHLRETMEDAGIMVSVSGTVRGNTHRPIDPEEFRGFVLSDEYAPLVFVNSNDSKSAQMFTLAHELVHIWLGKDGVFNLVGGMPFDNDTEKLCNQTAAELLIPGELLAELWPSSGEAIDRVRSMAQLFKVSRIAAAGRARDMGLISHDTFFDIYKTTQSEFQRHKKDNDSGGSYYNNATARLGKRFAHAVVNSTQSGELFYREAYRLTGLKGKTFDNFASRLKGEVT